MELVEVPSCHFCGATISDFNPEQGLPAMFVCRKCAREKDRNIRRMMMTLTGSPYGSYTNADGPMHQGKERSHA